MQLPSVTNALAALPEALVTVSADGSVTSANPPARRILGGRDPTGLQLDRVIEVIGRTPIPAYLRACLGSGQPVIARARARGTGADLRIEGLRLATSDAAPVILVRLRPATQVSATFLALNRRIEDLHREIVEQRATEEKLHDERARLEETVRQKDEFLAVLAHELRNPLSAIVSAAELLSKRARADDEGRRAITIVERQGRHLARIVADLLDAARVQTGRVTIETRPCDLHAAVVRSLQVLHAQGIGRTHRVAVDFPRSPLLVEADPFRLDQVLTNLLENAFKYTPESGSVDVSATRDGDLAVVSIRDTGIGLDPALIPKLFRPFVQGSTPLARSRGGLGLGLAVVRGLAEQHRGSVQAFSAGVGQGSTFTVRWPLATAVLPDEEGSGDTERVGLRIALIEDNADFRDALRQLLELEGHSVNVASEGRSGLELILETRPDVALVDIGLPLLDGYELARRLRRHAPKIPVKLVAITGYGQPADRRRAIAAGYDAHLTKPVDTDAVLDLLSELTDRSSDADPSLRPHHA